jgi:hypothetical protein
VTADAPSPEPAADLEEQLRKVADAMAVTPDRVREWADELVAVTLTDDEEVILADWWVSATRGDYEDPELDLLGAVVEQIIETRLAALRGAGLPEPSSGGLAKAWEEGYVAGHAFGYEYAQDTYDGPSEDPTPNPYEVTP